MKLTPIIFATLVAGVAQLHAAPLVKAGDVVAICGDSITQQKAYSEMIEEYLLMCQHVDTKQVVQFGWSGEQAAGLLARVDTELYPFQPTVVTTSYGMNDGHYEPLTPATGDAFRQALTGLIKSFRAHGVREIVIGGPGCVDSYYFRKFQNNAPFDPALPAMYNQTLGGLDDIARDVAKKEGVHFAEVHSLMMDLMAKVKAQQGEKHPFVSNGDGVHPGLGGHLIMAYAYLKALGCDGNIGTITLDLAAGRATGTPGQKILSSTNGTVEVESTRYPFCFRLSDELQVLSYLPFNQELNRYLLVVKGLNGKGAKVTWGKETKQYAAADLAKGINLAAEFLDNPLSEHFGQVRDAIQRQQEQDRELVQAYLHNLKAPPPYAMAAFTAAAQKGLEWDRSLYAVSEAMTGAVRHTVRVEVVQ